MIPEWNSFINADCMQYLPEFPDNYFDLAIVDPPYGGVSQGGYAKNQMKGKNSVSNRWTDYDLSLWAQDAPTKEYFDQLRRVSKNQIIWGGNYYASLLTDSQCWIVWDKMKAEGVDFADGELAWTSFNRALRIFHYRWNGMLQGDMKNKEQKIHPTQKPVNLYLWCLERFAKEGDTILDTHVGSASSLIACHRSNHKYIGFELCENYYKMARERLDAETAQMTIFQY